MGIHQRLRRHEGSPVDDIDRPGVELLPPLPIAQKSIDLSRALPLSFSVIPWNEIKDDNPHINAYIRYVKPMLDNVFVPHHTRWRSATFQEWPSLYELPFTWSITPNFPRLQQFSFTDSSSGATDPKPPEDPFAQGVIHVLKNAPVLRHLDVQLYGTDEHFDNWTPEDTCHRIATAIPWERLTTLSLFLGYMSVPESLRLFIGQCPNLESLILPILKDPFDTAAPGNWTTPIIQHSRLQELTFIEPEHPCCTKAPNLLTLPKLQSLVLPSGPCSFMGTSGRGPLIKAVMDLVERSSCQLRRLHYSTRLLAGRYHSEPELTLVLLQALSSSLEELEMDMRCVKPFTTELTVPTRAKQVFCPHLKKIAWRVGKQPDLLAIVDMIQSRQRSASSAYLDGVAKLQTVSITFSMKKPKEGDALDALWDPMNPPNLQEPIKRLQALAEQANFADESSLINPWPQMIRIASQVCESYPETRENGEYVYLDTTLSHPDMVRFYPSPTRF
ncbi:hypothetical protein D9611_011061 [Ephemerocybe angulata]|uniref:Uncharacterized protein n=1 Tax=Ephemerocybe angulata TaxID=980116 RepID=A0A8H5BD23_9AGAR|nr:hypothetical protein D9611_011061 [Tulosesus angulatus]